MTDPWLPINQRAIELRNLGRHAEADALFADTGICEHLKPVEEYIRSQGATVHNVGTPWSRNCRTWVYFANVILDADALRARFNLPAFVVTHVHRGTHDGAEQGIVCEQCHDALMGGHPELSPGARVVR